MVPKGDGSGKQVEWGPKAAGRASPQRLMVKSSQSPDHTPGEIPCTPPPLGWPPPVSVNRSAWRWLPIAEVFRGRRDDRDEDERRMRELSVKRRLGESSDLQKEATQLISQSEMRIYRIGKVRGLGFPGLRVHCG